MQNKLNELIMNGSSSSTEISSGSCTTVTNEWSGMEPWMLSPRSCDLFPNGELFDIYGLISEPETEIGVSQVSIHHMCILILELKHSSRSREIVKVLQQESFIRYIGIHKLSVHLSVPFANFCCSMTNLNSAILPAPKRSYQSLHLQMECQQKQRLVNGYNSN